MDYKITFIEIDEANKMKKIKNPKLKKIIEAIENEKSVYIKKERS